MKSASSLSSSISSKLPALETSIFTKMTLLAHRHKAINLAQGFPNFGADPKLVSMVNQAMSDGYNQYAPMEGIYSLREAISTKMEKLYGATYHPETEITVTVGATQAIYTTISALVKEGDEVIVLKPAYDCYEPSIKANGGVPVFVQMSGKDYLIDWKEVSEKLTARTRMIIINSPHNPSGRIFSKTDMEQLESLLANTGVVVLSDEAYEHIVFDGKTHESVAKYPELRSRSFICASFGKTFHTTGWKMGYCAAPEFLMKEFQKIHEFNVFCVNHPVQRALASYLREPKNYLELGAFFQQKRDFFLDAIKDSRFKSIPSEGTYFQLLDFSEITDESDVVFAERLTKDYGVASIPISVFNEANLDHRQLRFCFAKKEETLEAAAEILNSL